MAYRYTNTDKWQDVWFSNLKQIEMLLFLYLCDNCDIAGFIEINIKRWASDLSSTNNTIEGALKGLQRGLVFSKCNECIYIRNFIKHQKNYPLNEKNKAHIGILRRFELYSYKFDIKDINKFIEGASKGLLSPTGNGNSISIESIKSNIVYTYNQFYDSEIEKCNGDENYINFVKILFGNNSLKTKLSNVLSMPNQVTFEQFQTIDQYKHSHKIIVSDYLVNMENYKDLKKKNTTVQATLLNWIRRDIKRQR